MGSLNKIPVRQKTLEVLSNRSTGTLNGALTHSLLPLLQLAFIGLMLFNVPFSLRNLLSIALGLAAGVCGELLALSRGARDSIGSRKLAVSTAGCIWIRKVN